MKKYILQDNAYQAWTMAIKYCDDIISGKITLMYRKYFVESLQNAVELFIKQLMLNENDYRVAKIRNCDKNGEPIKSYISAIDLNKYFETLDDNIRSKFYSIDFQEIITNHRKILKNYFEQNNNNITVELKLLQRLRNEETHFYIEKIDFLSEKEFLQLYNFMITFYDILHSYGLLPYWGKPRDEHKRLSFARPKLSPCSYKNFLMQSPYVRRLVKIIDGKQYYGNPTDSAYLIADCLINTIDELIEDDFEELYVYVEMLHVYEILKFDGGYNEYEDETGKIYAEPEFYMLIVS